MTRTRIADAVTPATPSSLALRGVGVHVLLRLPPAGAEVLLENRLDETADPEDARLDVDLDRARALPGAGRLGADCRFAVDPIGEHARRHPSAEAPGLLVERLVLGVREALAEQLGDGPRQVELGHDADAPVDLGVRLTTLEELVAREAESFQEQAPVEVVVEKQSPAVVEIERDALDEGETTHHHILAPAADAHKSPDLSLSRAAIKRRSPGAARRVPRARSDRARVGLTSTPDPLRRNAAPGEVARPRRSARSQRPTSGRGAGS